MGKWQQFIKKILPEFAQTVWLPTIVVFVAFFAITLLAWRASVVGVHQEQQQAIKERTAAITDTLSRRLDAYEEILQGGVALFNASDEVTRSDWAQFVAVFDIPHRYQGVEGVGYIAVVPGSNKADFEQNIQQGGVGDYHIYPAGNRGSYAPIVYMEPQNNTNAASLGYDTLSSPQRQATLKEAADTAKTAITSKLSLLPISSSDTNAAKGPVGFVMYRPIYQKNTINITTAERQKNLIGYVFAPFRMDSFITGTFSSSSDELTGYRIYSNTPSAGNLLYTSDNFADLKTLPHHLTTHSVFSVSGSNSWVIDYAFSPDIVSRTVQYRPYNTIFGGFFISLLLAALVFLSLSGRLRSLNRQKDVEVQLAKDELLSLASHQLRTPATGVKQYLGMVLEGYGGRLNQQQQTFLGKAYASNERQLHIINELLYVAKVDSGRIVLAKRAFNMSDLVREVAHEQQADVDERQHTLQLRLPKKVLPIYGDEHCLRMAIENLLSNAIKYTPENGIIRVGARQTKQAVQVYIKDSGIGISRKELPLLFKQFSRLPNKLYHQTSGTGVGLYLAGHFVKLHGGSISVASKPGQGSTFTINLPKPSRLQLLRLKNSQKPPKAVKKVTV